MSDGDNGFPYDEQVLVDVLSHDCEIQPDYRRAARAALEDRFGRGSTARRVAMWKRLGLQACNGRIILTKVRKALVRSEAMRVRVASTMFADRAAECPPLTHVLGGARFKSQRFL